MPQAAVVIAAEETVEAKPTPGPWKADTDNWVRDSDGNLIASVSTNYRARDEVSAIRDLIAAAPAMLQALKTARQMIRHESLAEAQPCYLAMIERLDAAIKKAEGRA